MLRIALAEHQQQEARVKVSFAYSPADPKRAFNLHLDRSAAECVLILSATALEEYAGTVDSLPASHRRHALDSRRILCLGGECGFSSYMENEIHDQPDGVA